jgi:hypothetical protein
MKKLMSKSKNFRDELNKLQSSLLDKQVLRLNSIKDFGTSKVELNSKQRLNKEHSPQTNRRANYENKQNFEQSNDQTERKLERSEKKIQNEKRISLNSRREYLD